METASRSAAAPFLPADYQGEMFTDYAAMRENGLLDRLERLPMMSTFLERLAAAYCCDLEDLQRVRTALVFDPAGTGRSLRSISVAELDPAEAETAPEHWQPWQQGDLHGYQGDVGSFVDIVVRPRPGLVVAGERELVEPALAAGTIGGPHPDLAPFLLGDRILFQYAAGTFGRPAHEVTGTVGFFGYEEPEDPCEFLRLRLSAEADGGLVLSIAMRYRAGSANLRRSETGLRGFLERTLDDPEFAGLKPLLSAIAVTHSDRDLEAALRLGPPSEAIRTLERAFIAMSRIRETRMKR